jgi:hypothetical protein
LLEGHWAEDARGCADRSVTPFDTPEMARTVNWGVLGAANIATERVIPAMNEAPSATLLTVASRDEQKARAVAQVADRCPVHRTLNSEITFEYTQA